MTADLRPGVLFDVDGTLLDSNYLHVLAWWRAFDDTGHPGIPMERIHRTIGMASERLVEHLTGAPDQHAVEAHAERFADLRDQVVPLPGTSELVRRCAEVGLTVVLATSGKGADLEWMLPAIDAGDAVAGSTTSSDVEAAKPDPDLLTTAMEQHGLDPRRTVVVGDTVWDVRSAQNAHLPCITVTAGGISRGELEDAGAVEVYDDPADLLARFDTSLLGRHDPRK